MNTKLMTLLAASSLALAACGSSDVETAEVETEQTGAEVALSEEQPPLEGDSPFVSEQDVAESQTYGAETYGTDVEPIDGYETAMTGETYELNVDGLDAPRVLMLDTAAETATLDGEEYELTMDGERFSFDAPTTMQGEEQLMTYSGLYRDGMIEEGLVEAQGDGSSMGFTATPVENELGSEYGEFRSGVTETYRDGEAAMDELGNDIEQTGQEIEQTGENAYDRATDGSDATEALDPVDED